MVVLSNPMTESDPGTTSPSERAADNTPRADGQTVRGWLLRPARDQDAHGAGVVEFVGYGGGRGHPHEWLTWPSAGYTYLVVDARGQGSGYRTGVTPDTDPNGDTQVPGFLTRGIRSPGGYYYRRVYADAVRAVEALRVAPDVDSRFVAVAGTSQGGGLAIAAALADDVWALITAVPFLCDFRRGAELAPEGPFTELAAYCAQRPEESEPADAGTPRQPRQAGRRPRP